VGRVLPGTRADGRIRSRTRGALHLKADCGRWAPLVVPIPNKACIEEAALANLRKQIGVDPDTWSPELPVDLFLGLCQELSIPAVDPRAALRDAAKMADDGHVYYQKDWHLNPEGNRALASFVRGELDRMQILPAAVAGSKPAEIPASEKHASTAG
jgi:hypothetical protein